MTAMSISYYFVTKYKDEDTDTDKKCFKYPMYAIFFLFHILYIKLKV